MAAVCGFCGRDIDMRAEPYFAVCHCPPVPCPYDAAPWLWWRVMMCVDCAPPMRANAEKRAWVGGVKPDADL